MAIVWGDVSMDEYIKREDAKEAVHNVYLCTGFNPRNKVDANEKGLPTKGWFLLLGRF